MFTRTALLLITTLLAAVGCAVEGFEPDSVTGPVTGDDGDVDDGGDEFGQESGGDAGLMPKSDEPPPEAILACDLEVACEHPLELVRDAQTAGYQVGDKCALQHLASGATELVQTVAVFPDAEAYLDHVVDVDGALLRQAHGRSDSLGIWQKPVERCTLADTAFFKACLEQFDAVCLDPERWVVPGSCAPLGSLTCPQP